MHLFRHEEITLTQVRLKGSNSLEGIQFIFNNGALESPFFASAGSGPPSQETTQSEGAVSTFNFSDGRQIRKIRVTVNRMVLITRLEMSYE